MHVIRRFGFASFILGLSLFLVACWQDTPYEYSNNSASYPSVSENSLTNRELKIYCKCTSTTRLEHFQDTALSGLSIQVSWRDLEPEPGIYRWELIESKLQDAERKNLLVNIAVITGPKSPRWLHTQGAEWFTYSKNGDRTNLMELPIPWDSSYLDAYASFITEFGLRYDGDHRINIIRATNSTTDGVGMDYVLDRHDKDILNTAGFSEESMVNSWKTILDQFALSFSTTKIDIGLQPVMGNSDIAYRVAEYGLNLMGDRFGVFVDGWKIATYKKNYPEMFSLISYISERTFATAQISTAEQSQEYQRGLVGYFGPTDTIDLAMTASIASLEMSESDLKDPAIIRRLYELKSGNAGGISHQFQ